MICNRLEDHVCIYNKCNNRNYRHREYLKKAYRYRRLGILNLIVFCISVFITMLNDSGINLIEPNIGVILSVIYFYLMFIAFMKYVYYKEWSEN